jgi:hypothetical protein
MAAPRKSTGAGGGRGRGDDKKGDGKQGQRRGLFRRGKVLPRRISGTCAKHQRALRIAIVRARQLALLPYASD